MPTYKKRPDFFISEDGKAAFDELTAMAADKAYHTKSSYTANTKEYSDNLIPFVDKHMAYLRDHPNTNCRQYLSNLRLITKLK